MVDVITLAGIFGPVLVVIGLWQLLFHDNVIKVVDSVKKNPSVFYLSGVVNLIVGLTIINLSPHWQNNITVLVPILGWLLFLRAIFMFFFPKLLIQWTMTNKGGYTFFGIVGIIWGLALCWIAFL